MRLPNSSINFEGNKRSSGSSHISKSSTNTHTSYSSTNSKLNRSYSSPSFNKSDLLSADQTAKLKELYAHLLYFTGEAPISIFFNAWGENNRYRNHANIQNSLKSSVDRYLTPDEFKIGVRKMIRNESLDFILLRYLRKKNFNVPKSLELFSRFICWRVKSKVDALVSGGDEKHVNEKDEEFLHQLRSGKAFYTRGRDKNGSKLIFVLVQRHLTNTQSNSTMERFVISFFEDGRLILKPNLPGCAAIFDLTNFTLANLDYGAVKSINNCYKLYPNVLDHVYIYNAPRIFESVWKLLKVWLDPSLVRRVIFTKDLKKFINEDNLPPYYSNCPTYEDYQYFPHIPGENDKMKDVGRLNKIQKEWDNYFKLFVDLTIFWVQAPEGSDLETELTKHRIYTTENLKTTYFELDSYIRGRNIYDRNGLYGYFTPELCQQELEEIAKAGYYVRDSILLHDSSNGPNYRYGRRSNGYSPSRSSMSTDNSLFSTAWSSFDEGSYRNSTASSNNNNNLSSRISNSSLYRTATVSSNDSERKAHYTNSVSVEVI